MADFNKIKEILKNIPKEKQADALQQLAKSDEGIAGMLHQKALEKSNFDKRAGLATKTYQDSLKNPDKGITLTPTSQVADMQKGLEGRLTAKQKILEAYKSDPFPAVVKPEPKVLVPTQEDNYIKSKLSIEDEANKLKKADLGKSFDIDNSNKATTLGIKNKPSSMLENLYSKKAIQEGMEAGAKAGVKSGAKAGMKTLPVLGAIGAGLWSGADAYADTGSMKEALKAGGAEAANITPIPTEIITGAIEDRDAIKKDLLLNKYSQEAEDQSKIDYTNSPAKQAKLNNYEDGGVEMNSQSKNDKIAFLKRLAEEKAKSDRDLVDTKNRYRDSIADPMSKEEDNFNLMNEHIKAIENKPKRKYADGGKVSSCGKFNKIKARLK